MCSLHCVIMEQFLLLTDSKDDGERARVRSMALIMGPQLVMLADWYRSCDASSTLWLSVLAQRGVFDQRDGLCDGDKFGVKFI